MKLPSWLSNILWMILGAAILTFIYLINNKKDVEEVLSEIDTEADEKRREVKNDLSQMSDTAIIDKYGNRESASRIIDESRNRLANRARAILSGFGSNNTNI